MNRALILIAALVTAPVYADAIATAPNRAGGVITLTDVDCPQDTDTKIAYSAGKHGEKTILGCWWYTKPDVMIQWKNTGNITTLPAAAFDVVDDYQRKPAGRGM